MSKLEELKQRGLAPDFLTEEGLQTLEGGYLLPGESPRDMWARCAYTASNILKKPELFNKFFDFMWKGWLCLATPVCANFGSPRALPISCYSVSPEDCTISIMDKLTETAMLSKYGGGVGVYLGDLRPARSKISGGGFTDGIIPFAKMYDSVTVGISQGGVRRGATALYLPIEHGDATDFLRIRREEGDPNRQCLNVHHGVTITDEFMKKCESGDSYSADKLKQLYASRLETGEPYMVYIDNANRHRPQAYVNNNLYISTSNLCSEIFLHTDPEHTFVCCLSSLNLAKYDEWKDTDLAYWAIWFLDAVMTEFIQKASYLPGLENAVRFAEKGRALGLGVLGFHTLLQEKMMPYGSFGAKILNKAIAKNIQEHAIQASKDLAGQYGEPEWCRGTGMRNTHLLANAPTTSNAIISGNVSQSTEPINANVFVKKSAKGTFIQRNLQLASVLEKYNKNTDDVWSMINKDAGSVRNLSFLTKEEKEVFKTAFEIDQMHIVDMAADRQQYIDQGQSLNLFFAADIDPQYFHDVHWYAWKRGIKSLYYVRTSSVLRADLSSRGECEACEG